MSSSCLKLYALCSPPERWLCRPIVTGGTPATIRQPQSGIMIIKITQLFPRSY